jgi:glycerol-3-phosphate dehydrogenase
VGLVVIGGGITGAGILLEAARRGLKALLLEQRDFAWGTSSRSSKLVHGGLRYLKEGQLGLTRESVHEREHLLQQAAGLVEPQSFAFGDYAGRKPGKRMFLLGLAMYDRLAGQRSRHYYERESLPRWRPMSRPRAAGRHGLYRCQDGRCAAGAACAAGSAGAWRGSAQLYGGAGLLRDGEQGGGHGDGQGSGPVREQISGKAAACWCAMQSDMPQAAPYAVRARVVISATGAWADGLRLQAGKTAAFRHSAAAGWCRRNGGAASTEAQTAALARQPSGAAGVAAAAGAGYQLDASV